MPVWRGQWSPDSQPPPCKPGSLSPCVLEESYLVSSRQESSGRGERGSEAGELQRGSLCGLEEQWFLKADSLWLGLWKAELISSQGGLQHFFPREGKHRGGGGWVCLQLSILCLLLPPTPPGSPVAPSRSTKLDPPNNTVNPQFVPVFWRGKDALSFE